MRHHSHIYTCAKKHTHTQGKHIRTQKYTHAHTHANDKHIHTQKYTHKTSTYTHKTRQAHKHTQQDKTSTYTHKTSTYTRQAHTLTRQAHTYTEIHNNSYLCVFAKCAKYVLHPSSALIGPRIHTSIHNKSRRRQRVDKAVLLAHLRGK